MKYFIFCWFSLLALNGFAHDHREHGAHVHGSGTLGIAFDEAKGKIDFKIPSESLFGFEHAARTEKDKKTVSDAFSVLEKNISEMIVFDSTLKCQIGKDKIEMVPETQEEHAKESGKVSKKEVHGEHSDTVAQYSVACAKSPVGTKIVFNFQKFFPHIRDLDVQVLAGSLQKSFEAKQSGAVLELK